MNHSKATASKVRIIKIGKKKSTVVCLELFNVLKGYARKVLEKKSTSISF